jgi:hypothetical protein
MTKEKITFQINIPIEVKLAYSDGKKVTGPYGDSFMYTLQGDKIMFVPQYVRDRIQQLQLKVGEPFRICKRELRSAEGKTWVEWQVNMVTRSHRLEISNRSTGNEPSSQTNGGSRADPALTIPQKQEIAQPTNQSETLRRSTLDQLADKLESSTPPAVNMAASDVETTPKPNGSGENAITQSMRKALEAALDATKAVEQYAEQIGFVDRNGDPFRFSHLDIRAIGLSMFIESRKLNW